MDPYSTGQDVHRCDLCETATVHSYCDFCHVNLCKPCVVDHISDRYDKHKVVPFQDRGFNLIYPQCEVHSFKICEFQCENCNNILVCSFCMASEKHRGHKFLEVTEVYKTKKEVIKKDTKELKNYITPTYKEIVFDLEEQLANLDGEYEILTTEISKQGELWHREIDIVINEMKIEISEIKKKHKDILQKQLGETKQMLSRIKQTLPVLRELEKLTEMSPIVKYTSRIRDFSNIPLKVKVTLPTFIRKQIDHDNLYSLLGQITPLSTATEENVLSLDKPNTSARELLDEPELVSTIQTWHKNVRSIICINEDKIWTSGETNDIKCFNIEGSLVQTIYTKSGFFPSDIAVDSDANLVVSDKATRKVLLYKVENRLTEDLIRFKEWVPGYLCVTSTGDLLVTMYSVDQTQSKVVRYSGSTEKQTIQFDEKGEPLYSGNNYTKYITENRNHDICVADYGAGAVVVVDQDGEFNWRYNGHPSISKKKPFKPYGITADSKSHILTADSDNHCIHILDQNGQFLRYIDSCDLKDPYGLCVDNYDNLFVSEYYRGNVKKLRQRSDWDSL